MQNFARRCIHCGERYDQHADGKCLFENSRYTPEPVVRHYDHPLVPQGVPLPYTTTLVDVVPTPPYPSALAFNTCEHCGMNDFVRIKGPADYARNVCARCGQAWLSARIPRQVLLV